MKADRKLEWFDAHLDLAYLAVLGRDLESSVAEASRPDAAAALTLPSLRQGHVTRCLATIFTEAGGTDAASYPPDDAEAAHAAGARQADIYRELFHVEHHVRPMGSPGRTSAPAAGPPIEMGVLIEGADPIREPGELAWWAERLPVVALGMAWWKPSRYAGGNGTQTGLTDLGRALVKEIDRLGIVHDASHLSDRALAELLEATDQRVIASHSNCRALLGDPTNQRHLTDEQVRAIVARDGVIGLNLFSAFLVPKGDERPRATIAECVAHVEHVCAVAGDRRHVGLGSDMDGGFAATRLPEGINQPADLVKIAEALSDRGWGDADIAAFAHGNWGRVFGG